MTIAEGLLVSIVALLVTKPSDIPSILRHVKSAARYIKSIHKEILSYFDTEDDTESINLYINKISDLGFKYDGEYTLQSIKTYYRNLVKNNAKNTGDNLDNA